MEPTSTWPARSLEDALGPADGRYFGSGYRAVGHKLLTSATTARCDYTGTAELTYPAGWSEGEDGAARQPHLSTIDAVVLPLMALESRLPPEGELTLDSCFVSSIDLRAGSEPWVDLNSVPVTVSLGSSNSGSKSTSIHFDAISGNIKARLTLTSSARAYEPSVDGRQRSSTTQRSPYTNLYRSNESQSLLTGFDADHGVLTATHSFHTTSAERDPSGGIERSFWPALTVVDYLVTMGQLAQALIVLRHGIGRTGTLWMRRMTIEIPEVPLPLPGTIDTTTAATKDRTIDRGGRLCRDVVIDSRSSNGVKVKAMLAHVEES